MTREEEIIKQVEIYTNDVSNLAEWGDGWEDYNDYKYVKKAFINGAKWADETMIEKVYKRLEDYAELTGFDSETIKEFFKKVMEE